MVNMTKERALLWYAVAAGGVGIFLATGLAGLYLLLTSGPSDTVGGLLSVAGVVYSMAAVRLITTDRG